MWVMLVCHIHKLLTDLNRDERTGEGGTDQNNIRVSGGTDQNNTQVRGDTDRNKHHGHCGHADLPYSELLTDLDTDNTQVRGVTDQNSMQVRCCSDQN